MIFLPVTMMGQSVIWKGGYTEEAVQQVITPVVNTSILTDIVEQDKERELMRIVDYLGRETELIYNKPLLYIYSDGTIEKKIVVK